MNIVEYICKEPIFDAFDIRKSDAYKHLLREFDGNVTLFDQTITPQQRLLLLELESQRNLLASMDEETMFICGFRLGANLMLELLRPERPLEKRRPR
ncbi:MAG: hypothetical protein IJD81_05195 [Oscillospiraceae bacterium]|nr:hypothetical protein [Oscillospiraceae bacterium]